MANEMMATTEMARVKMKNQECESLFQRAGETRAAWLRRFVMSKRVVNQNDDNYVIVAWAAARVLNKTAILAMGNPAVEYWSQFATVVNILETFVNMELSHLVVFIADIGLDLGDATYNKISRKTEPFMHNKNIAQIRTQLFELVGTLDENFASLIYEECIRIYVSCGIDLSPST